jgi:flagellar M-ring protein FliF
MNLLNRAMAQLNDLFRSMSAGTRMTAALLLIVVVVSLGYLFQSQTAGPDSYLLGGHPFSPGEMPAVLGALAQAGLNDFEVEGNLIRIPKAKQSAYLAALADANRLPISFGDRLIDVVERQSPFSSGKQQEAILKQALNSMLAKSISQMAGIESADVYTDTKEKRGFKSEPQATAAVHVRTLGSQPLTAAQAFAIRSLVAGAILGLSRDQVSVIDAHHGKTFTGDGESGGSGGFDHPYLSLKREYESEFQNDIESLLSYVPGVNVSVNVELSKMQHSEEESQKFDPKPVAGRAAGRGSRRSSPIAGHPSPAPDAEPRRARRVTAARSPKSLRPTSLGHDMSA